MYHTRENNVLLKAELFSVVPNLLKIPTPSLLQHSAGALSAISRARICLKKTHFWGMEELQSMCEVLTQSPWCSSCSWAELRPWAVVPDVLRFQVCCGSRCAVVPDVLWFQMCCMAECADWEIPQPLAKGLREQRGLGA